MFRLQRQRQAAGLQMTREGYTPDLFAPQPGEAPILAGQRQTQMRSFVPPTDANIAEVVTGAAGYLDVCGLHLAADLVRALLAEHGPVARPACVKAFRAAWDGSEPLRQEQAR